MIWKTAWKNVWRNKVRSLVVIASVTSGVFAAVFSIAFMNGMIAQRVDSALDQEISHIQVTGKGFRLNNDPAIIIPDLQKTMSEVNSIEGISGTVKRRIIGGMAGTASKSAGVTIVGINPEDEKKIFTLDKAVMPGTGSYFEGNPQTETALIGQDLAKELDIIRFSVDSTTLEKLKARNVPNGIIEKLTTLKDLRFPDEKKFDKTVKKVLSEKESRKFFYLVKQESWKFRSNARMVLTFLDSQYNQVGARFRIGGVYDTKNSIFEISTVFVRDSVLQKLTGYANSSVNQIIIRINDAEQTEEITARLRKILPDVEVMNWKELQPDLAMMTDYVHQIYGILMVIIMAALAFGIVNTMLMAVLERTKELGMLTAIGMNKRKVFSMIMLESVFLSLIGGIAGMFVAYIVILLTARNGINFLQYAQGMEAFGYSAHIFPEINVTFFFMMAVLVILTGIVSSVYPALKALKLKPVEAIRTE